MVETLRDLVERNYLLGKYLEAEPGWDDDVKKQSEAWTLLIPYSVKRRWAELSQESRAVAVLTARMADALRYV